MYGNYPGLSGGLGCATPGRRNRSLTLGRWNQITRSTKTAKKLSPVALCFGPSGDKKMVANAFQTQIAIPIDRPQAFQRTVPTAARINSTATVACTRDATALSLQKLSRVKTSRRITKRTRVPTNSNMAVTNQFEYLRTGPTAPPACRRVAELTWH